jgi:hypothetical protein
MLPFFSHPLAFAGLAALPALVAIYWLRNRFRPYPVSSLMLWLAERQIQGGGTRLQRFQSPLLFFLELAILLLLVLAAAGPYFHGGQARQPLVVVLDDSFSMNAGGDDSPRRRAATALEEELRRNARYSIRFVLAGERPQLLGDPAHSTAEALKALDSWKCRAPDARLDEAITLASEIGGERAVLVVLTDHASQSPPGKGKLAWWAFGKPRPNVAFVNAARTPHDGGDRCLLEIGNLSTDPTDTTLTIETGEPPTALRRESLRLGPGETHRMILNLQEDTPALHARLGHDDLEIDNEVTLLPERARPARVQVRIADETMRGFVERAVKASRAGLPAATRPDLVITDAPQAADSSDDAWVLHLLRESDAQAYGGPFVVDRGHPLSEGLSLQSVIWGGGKTETLDGAPVVLAGKVPLLTDRERPDGGHEIILRLRPDLATLQDSPNWPILIENVLRWRMSRQRGMARSNVRLGEEAVLNLPGDAESVHVIDPDGKSRKFAVQGRQVALRGDEIGVYRFEAGGWNGSFAVNALRREESDLRASASGRWGEWAQASPTGLEYRSVAWIFLLGVLAILSLHLALIARGGQT